MSSTSQGEAEPDLPSDLEAIAGYASALVDEVRSALPSWLAGAVQRRCAENGIAIDSDEDLGVRVARAGEQAANEIAGRLSELLALDIDEQWTNPLSIIRTATSYGTEILQSLGCPPAVRDDFSKRANPDDIYDLSLASFAELGPTAQDLGIRWGAAKAHIHMKRRKAAGQ